jgi:hypothetical protein
MESEKKFVAFFDIIGFKNWIDLEGSKEVFNYMRGYLDFIFKVSLPGSTANPDMTVNIAGSKINYINFSDSIIYYSIDDSYESFEAIIRVCNDFMAIINGLNTKKFSILTKGAISHGDFFVDIDTRSFVGEALIKSYLLEKDINWLGLCFHHELTRLDCYAKFAKEHPNLIVESLTPLLNSHPEVRPYALNWADKSYNAGVSMNVKKVLSDSIERKKIELAKNPVELNKIMKRITRTTLN